MLPCLTNIALNLEKKGHQKLARPVAFLTFLMPLKVHIHVPHKEVSFPLYISNALHIENFKSTKKLDKDKIISIQN